MAGNQGVSRSTNVFDLLDAEIFGEESADVSPKLEEWMNKLGRFAKAAKARAKASCCYCGSEASMEPQPCNLSCSCDWEMAHDVWVTNIVKSAERPAEYEDNMIYVEQLFTKAITEDTENSTPLLVADFALFLWKQKGDLLAVEAMLNKALAMKQVTIEERTLVLNLYSFFLSSTPPVSMKKGLTHYRKSYAGAP